MTGLVRAVPASKGCQGLRQAEVERIKDTGYRPYPQEETRPAGISAGSGQPWGVRELQNSEDVRVPREAAEYGPPALLSQDSDVKSRLK